REFTTGLLRLLVEHDVDPADVADIHPEIRIALAAIGAEPPPEREDDDPDADVANCIRQLGHADPAARTNAAEAL
ncbi:hypothetical protein, partial [Zavarzinella formosa]|uniref:hypothetical protein n=1 Tax=Zavarzinella formosa TaxID=360055 RepID=UPI00059295BF